MAKTLKLSKTSQYILSEGMFVVTRGSIPLNRYYTDVAFTKPKLFAEGLADDRGLELCKAKESQFILTVGEQYNGAWLAGQFKEFYLRRK